MREVNDHRVWGEVEKALFNSDFLKRSSLVAASEKSISVGCWLRGPLVNVESISFKWPLGKIHFYWWFVIGNPLIIFFFTSVSLSISKNKSDM